jgi:hypothetical protein
MIYAIDGVNILQFGSGDIKIGAGSLIDNSGRVSVSFTPCVAAPVGTNYPDDVGRKDTDIGIHTRLVFPEIAAIDILIDALNGAKAMLLGDAPRPVLKDEDPEHGGHGRGNL